MKNKKILILILILGFLGIIPNYLDAQRRTEVVYPEIPGMTVPPTDTNVPLPQFMSYAFNLVISLCGLVCFASLVYGAVIFITSRGNPSAMANARSQILAAFLGTVLSLGSLMIAQTVNPELLVPKATILVNTNLCLCQGADCAGCGSGGGRGGFGLEKEDSATILATILDRTNPFKIFAALARVDPGLPCNPACDWEPMGPCIPSKPHMSAAPGGGVCCCPSTGLGTAEPLTVIADTTRDIGEELQVNSLKFYSKNVDAIIYPDADFQGSPFYISGSILEDPQVQSRDGCYVISGTTIQARSVQMRHKTPGIYVCTEPYQKMVIPGTTGIDPILICPGLERHIPGTISKLPEELDNKIKGLMVVDQTEQEIWAYKDEDPSLLHTLEAECETDVPSGMGGKWSRDSLTGNYLCTYPTKRYGAVLHDLFEGRGPAEILVENDLDLTADDDGDPTTPDNNFLRKDNTINTKTSSITVFSRPIIYSVATDKGVWFCEKANQELNQNRADCHGPFTINMDCDLPGAGDINCPLGNGASGVPEDNTLSVIIEGDFIAILFSEPNFDGFAQVLTKTFPDLRDNPMGRCDCITDVLGIEQSWGCRSCLSSFITLPISGN